MNYPRARERVRTLRAALRRHAQRGAKAHGHGGFTITEVLIVCSVLSILATIAVPAFVRSRIGANEGAVIGTLRTITKAELQFRALDLVDTDRNGGFEYGTLGEITGARDLRGTTERLSPKLLSVSLSALDAKGRVMRHGYHFALFLPDAAGKGLAEVPANAGSIDPTLAQDYWTCVAWPAQVGTTGRVTFFVNQQGQTLKTTTPYSGDTRVPPAGCGLVGVPPDEIDSQQLAVDTVGADGGRWTAVH